MFGLNRIYNTLSNVEGYVKSIRYKVWNLFEITNQIATQVNIVFDLLVNPKETDQSDFYFSKFEIEGATFEGRITKITMNEFQQVSGTYAAQKRDGRPAKVQNPRLETDQPDLVLGEIDEANSRITLRAKKGVIDEDTPVAVKVIADADLGDGVKEIEIVGALLITPGEAEKMTLQFEEPVDRTDAPGEETTEETTNL